MTRMLAAGLVFLASLLLLPGIARAQASEIGIVGYGAFGSTMFTAKDTFEAVGEKSREINYGGGAQLTFWKGLGADVSFSQIKVDGQRVFVDGTTVYRLGIPVTIRMQPFDLAATWRMVRGPMAPYMGGGMTRIAYKETSPFAASGDDVDESQVGALVLGGVDIAVVKWLFVGGEFKYRKVSGVLGEAGVSKGFGEDSLGGFAASLRVSVGR